MTNLKQRIQIMQELLYSAHKLCYWHLDENMALISSNCPNQDFFFGLFTLSQNSNAIQEHFAVNKNPLVVSDKMGIVWIAGKHQGQYHLLGPFFSMEASESYIRQMCYRMHVPSSFIQGLLSQLKFIPIIHANASFRYGIMLQCCLTGAQLTPSDITLQVKPTEDVQTPEWAASSWHGTWAAEMELFNRIKEGNMDGFAELATKFAAGNIGTMSHGDPLRQAKNEGIVFATLCSRASILGGISPEGGYNLTDYYILRMEAAKTVSAVQYISSEMLEAFVRRVQQAKENSKYSVAVASCMEYIQTHICEKISLDAMAKELGYSSYYLSGKFQKELGVSLNSYINQQKIEQAKLLLASQSLNAADVSERLAFSSPSYFTAIFRKHTGITPSAWSQGGNQV